jgi:hypothetical protein
MSEVLEIYFLHQFKVFKVPRLRSKMTLNYWMMMERYPNLKKVVGNLIPDCEISSLIDKKNLSCGQMSPMLWRWPVGLLSKIK